MADASIGYEASDLFGLASFRFVPQSSGTSTPSSNFQVLGADGDVSCERDIFERTDYTQNYKYCGSEFFGAIQEAIAPFGSVQNSKYVDSVTINMTASDYVSVDISGHNHDTNAHDIMANLYNAVDFLPYQPGESLNGWDGFGVPDFGITLGDDCSPASATVTISGTHTDEIAEDGQHLVGTTTNVQCSLSMEFNGIPTSNTVAAIQADLRANTDGMLDVIVDSIDSQDSNSAHDSFSFEAHASVQRISE